jgi:hypothetical protein
MMEKARIVIFAMIAFSSLFVDEASRGLVQVVIVAVCILGVLTHGVARRAVPRVVLLLATAGTTGGALFHYSTINLGLDSFLVATRTDSDLREDVKIYRDRLRRSVRHREAGKFSLSPSTITTQAEAEMILKNNATLGGVVWGDARWRNVSLQHLVPISVRALGAQTVGRDLLDAKHIGDLLVVRSIPSFGLSDGDTQPSVDFIATFAALWGRYADTTLGMNTNRDFDGAIRSLARSRSRWTSRVHLGVPFWMEGNFYLVQALRSEIPEYGVLDCAIRSFRLALKQARPTDNPALIGAIKNNLSVALHLRAHIQGRGNKTRKMATKNMRRAKKVKFMDVRTKAAISHNLSALKFTTHKRRKRGKRGKRG